MNREKPMNEYLAMLKPLLNASNYNTGVCQPSSYVKNADHMAVLLDGKPIYLTGSGHCDRAQYQARHIASNETFKLGLAVIGLVGDISYGVVSGVDIDWKETHCAIARVRDVSGTDEINEMVGINLTESEPLGLLMCINESLTAILDHGYESADSELDLHLLRRADGGVIQPRLN
jgi:hypothetical protein